MSVKSLNINFKLLVMEEGILVFMMGLSNLEEIVSKLIFNGKNLLCFCGVVMRGILSK